MRITVGLLTTTDTLRILILTILGRPNLSISRDQFREIGGIKLVFNGIYCD